MTTIYNTAWLRTTAALLDFIAVHGRRPHRTAPSDTERALYTWHCRQRAAAERGALNTARIAFLDAHLPDWVSTNSEVA